MQGLPLGARSELGTGRDLNGGQYRVEAAADSGGQDRIFTPRRHRAGGGSLLVRFSKRPGEKNATLFLTRSRAREQSSCKSASCIQSKTARSSLLR